MGTIVDYVKHVLSPFEERPFSSADSLVLNQLVYLDMPALVPRLRVTRKTDTGEAQRLFRAAYGSVALRDLDRADWYPAMTRRMSHGDEARELLRAAAESPRFRSIRIGNFVEPENLQDPNRFSACTFDLPNGIRYVTFRGTDGTLAGWHEDYRLLFVTPPLPTQAEAAQYTHAVLAGWEGSVMLGGHSMGGNLATYVAAAAPRRLQSRIKGVYAADSPGFIASFIATPGFQAIKHKIHKIIPESSMIGMLFESGVEVTTVRSNARGIDQHFMTSWLFDDTNERFLTTNHLSRYSTYFAQTLNTWGENVDIRERQNFIDTLFAALGATGYDDFQTLVANWKTSLPLIRDYLRALPKSEQDQLNLVLGCLRDVAIGSRVPTRSPGTRQTGQRKTGNTAATTAETPASGTTEDAEAASEQSTEAPKGTESSAPGSSATEAPTSPAPRQSGPGLGSRIATLTKDFVKWAETAGGNSPETAQKSPDASPDTKGTPDTKDSSETTSTGKPDGKESPTRS